MTLIDEIRDHARDQRRIAELEEALRAIARKRIMDAVTAVQMRAIARAALSTSGLDRSGLDRRGLDRIGDERR